MKCAIVTLLLALALLGRNVSGQTFQYSKGWTVGKRALEENPIGSENNKIVLTTGQLMKACRNFINLYREEDDLLGIIGSRVNVLNKREAGEAAATREIYRRGTANEI